MDRKGRNWDKELISGSGRSIRGNILTYSKNLKQNEAQDALQNQQARELIRGSKDVPLVEFMYLVFTSMLCGSYRR